MPKIMRSKNGFMVASWATVCNFLGSQRNFHSHWATGGVVAQSPCILGGCEHIFCHVCVEKYLGASCPHCHIPAHVKDADVNRQLFNIASLCQKLRDVLSNPVDEEIQTRPDGEVLSELAECTPKQQVKDIYHFDTPTDNEKAKQQTRSKKNRNEPQKTEKKIKKKLDKREVLKTDSERKEPTKTLPNENANTRNGKGRKRTSCLPKTRNDVPSDQSTMTQFYEDDENDQSIAENLQSTSTGSSGLKLQANNEQSDSEAVMKEIPDLKATKMKKKRTKAAEIITEMYKTTRLRRKSDVMDDNFQNANGPERSNWFEEMSDTNESSSCNQDKEKKQELTEDSTVPAVSKRKSQKVHTVKSAKGKHKVTENENSVTAEPSSEVGNLIQKRQRSKRSRSPANKCIGQEDTELVKAKVDKDKVPKEMKQLVQKRETSPSVSLDTPKRQNRLSSEKKPSTPRLPKENDMPAHQRSKVKGTCSPRTPLASGNRLQRSKIRGAAGISPGTTLSPSNKSTPQRSKVVGSPAALSPAINKRNAKGETPLQVAAIKNDEQKVRELLTAGANPNVRDNAGWTPLHEACNRGYTEVAKLLLDNGAMMNVPGMDNDTPLHDAVSNNRIECVKLLVSRGASVTVRNLQGLTPEDLASSSDVMKEALKTAVIKDTISSSQLPLDTLEYQQPCFLGTSLSREQKVVLQKCANLLSAKQSDEITPEVTHVITSCNDKGLCARTIKYLQAVLTGKWIVSMDWVNTCLELGSRVCEEGFEVRGTSTNPDAQAPLKGRMNRKQQLPALFDGCQFYFHGNFEFSMPSKDDLVDVIKSGGGKILNREPKPGHLNSLDLTVPYHADPQGTLANCCVFIVHENSAKFQPIRTRQMCSVPVSWIMTSAAEFKFQDI